MSNSVKETVRDKMISDLTKYYFTRKGNKSYFNDVRKQQVFIR